MRGDHGGYGAPFATKAENARHSRPWRRRRDFPDQGGDGATNAEPAWLSRATRRRRDFPDQGGIDADFQTKENAARLHRPINSSSRPRWIRRDFPQIQLTFTFYLQKLEKNLSLNRIH